MSRALNRVIVVDASPAGLATARSLRAQPAGTLLRAQPAATAARRPPYDQPVVVLGVDQRKQFTSIRRRLASFAAVPSLQGATA